MNFATGKKKKKILNSPTQNRATSVVNIHIHSLCQKILYPLNLIKQIIVLNSFFI